MAKVNIELDTKSGVLSVTINGKAIEDVDGVRAFKFLNFENELRVHVAIDSLRKDDDVTTHVTTTAKEIPEIKQLIDDGKASNSPFEEFVEIYKNPQLFEDIAAFLDK